MDLTPRADRLSRLVGAMVVCRYRPSTGWVLSDMETKHTKVYLPDDVSDWVRGEAARRRSTTSAVIRDLVVAAMLKTQQTEAAK